LDELESSSRRRLAGLLDELGQHDIAARTRLEAQAYGRLERRFLRRFERIVTASDIETERLRPRAGGVAGQTWPNIVSTPPDHAGAGARGGRRLLFVGSMGYLPNRAAVHYAAREILPRLQRMADRPVVLRVAGAGGGAADFAGLQDVEWLGMVPDLTPLYA